ncbi:hypothetical protein GH714_018344 [Hevea brasiliensis]|uniref:U-box domain-containing protein n=1 Tax=Hevea brasiliensis TaxID=3981 RepID=A0A6A6KTF1_HEVBR|nr:hypothetical protein GH714_018344 [Hevea brasiliensis]
MALLENIVTISENALLQTASTSGAIRALVETIEEGSPQCKEQAVVILLLICQSCREKQSTDFKEGVMPGLLQLSVDGTWRAKDTAQELLLLLRDCSCYGSRSKQSKHELIEQIMQEIDAEGERVMGTTTLRMLEEMIAKLRLGLALGFFCQFGGTFHPDDFILIFMPSDIHGRGASVLNSVLFLQYPNLW